MAFGRFGGMGRSFGIAASAGGAVAPASFDDGLIAPAGMHWELVSDDGATLTDDVTAQPIVDLAAN